MILVWTCRLEIEYQRKITIFTYTLLILRFVCAFWCIIFILIHSYTKFFFSEFCGFINCNKGISLQHLGPPLFPIDINVLPVIKFASPQLSLVRGLASVIMLIKIQYLQQPQYCHKTANPTRYG